MVIDTCLGLFFGFSFEFYGMLRGVGDNALRVESMFLESGIISWSVGTSAQVFCTSLNGNTFMFAWSQYKGANRTMKLK